MSEMVERVTRAICGIAQDPDRVTINGPKAWTLYRRDARAAIAAMREPTGGMSARGSYTIAVNSDIGDAFDAANVWQAMIDEALK